MSRSESAAELSMEDILASIRSLVPADQRGEDSDGKGHGMPPIPPTLNRVERAPPPPPTLPLGTLAPTRGDGFEDDLADLLDEPAALPPRPTVFDAGPALDAGVPPPSSPVQTLSPVSKPAAPAQPLMTGRGALDLDALFARPAADTQPDEEPGREPLPPFAPSLSSFAAEVSPEPPAAFKPDESPVPPPPPPSVPSLMGLGQNTGFFPPPFGKRPVPPPPATPAEPAERPVSEAASEPTPQQVSPSIPPLRRSTFFPASYQPVTPAAPMPQPVAEAHKPEVMPPLDTVEVSARPDTAAHSPALAQSAEASAAEDERVSYSDALDQALKRLQGLGTLLPEPASPPVAEAAPRTTLEAFAFEPRTFDAPRTPFIDETKAPASEPVVEFTPEPEAVPTSEVAFSAESDATAEAPADASVAAEEPVALIEVTPPVDAPAEVQAPIEAVAEDVTPAATPAPAQQPTVRLSDTLWSKSAPSQVSETPPNSDTNIPDSVDLLDVPHASPVAQAFGALALGLAGGGSAAIGSTTAAPAAPSAPPAPLIVAEEPAPAPAPEPPRQVASAVALRPAEDPLQFASQTFGARVSEAQVQPSQAQQAVGAPRTLEDMVADMLRPMLKQWLEANMPRIVEKALRAETSERQRD